MHNGFFCTTEYFYALYLYFLPSQYKTRKAKNHLKLGLAINLCVCVWNTEIGLLSNNIMDYHFVSQGKTTIPGVDDKEEFLITDVSQTLRGREHRFLFIVYSSLYLNWSRKLSKRPCTTVVSVLWFLIITFTYSIILSTIKKSINSSKNLQFSWRRTDFIQDIHSQ